MKLIDTHTHLFDEAFDEDRPQTIQRALDSGVCHMMCPAIDSASHEGLFALCDTYPNLCLPMMGLHPTSVNDNPLWQQELDIVEQFLSNKSGRRFYAVGEVGLDFYWSKDYRKEQHDAFIRQVECSIKYSLPLVIHTRDAWEDMLTILKKYKGKNLRGVMHAFSGTVENYRSIKGYGDFLFGIGGVVTYKKSTLPDILTEIPLSDIVLETDSPYLPPVPFRGKRNETSHITYICEKIANIKGITTDEVAGITTENAVKLFGLQD